MPDYFSHSICAEIIYERLDAKQRRKIENKTLYLLGAQGGDVYFMYNSMLSENNVGRRLHRRSATEIFQALKDGNPSYAAGYATHYALDSTLHPAVYAYEDRHKTFLSHLRFESDLGLYISKYYGMRRTILQGEKIVSCTSPIYDNLKLIDPTVTVTGVERCLKRYVKYTKHVFRSKKQNYKCNFDFSALTGAIEDAVEFGVTAVNCVLNGDIDQEIFSKEFLQH